MKWLWWVFSICLGAAATLLTAPFLIHATLLPAALSLLVFGTWLAALWRRSRIFNMAFIGSMLLTLYASALPLPFIIPLATTILLLVTWDLSEFILRLREYDPGPAAGRLVRLHLDRLAGVAGLGFLLGGLALLFKLRIAFEVAVVLGLLIFLGLAQAIRFLRSLSD